MSCQYNTNEKTSGWVYILLILILFVSCDTNERIAFPEPEETEQCQP